MHYRRIFLSILSLAYICTAYAIDSPDFNIVADSITHSPLANASVFDRNGKFLGTSSPAGTITCTSAGDYPITIRYMGFREKHVPVPTADTIFLQENISQLPEVVIESRHKNMLHILAYTREYSTLSTYTDTVTLFREKMIDFMLPDDNKTRFKGWNIPRILNSRSYYHFTNAHGLDSVSDRWNNHFTWSDWIGIPPRADIPRDLVISETGTASRSGKYSPAEMWDKTYAGIAIDIDVLNDTTCHRWVPGISPFFKKDDIDFDQFRIRFNYLNTSGSQLNPSDLTGYSFNIETRGRGLGMVKFNRHDESIFVTTYTEVYILDREYISEKEARKWAKRPSDAYIDIYESPDAPELQTSIKQLIARVETIDHDKIRLTIEPDKRLAGRVNIRRNFGQAALQRIKGIFGIDKILGRRKQNRQWKDFRKKQVEKNHRSNPSCENDSIGI